ncbi:hypothetical protein DRW03_11240 [Corallococcus sp. H22C18031201]|nr:hypothetical protein DRW03_11240 [Corallococcus sp. H22C18031201]
MALRWPIPLLLVVLVGCSGPTRAVRLFTGRGEPRVHTPRGADAEPVDVDEERFVEATEALARNVPPPAHPQKVAQRLFEVGARGGAYVYEARSGRVVPGAPGEWLADTATAAELDLTRAYLRWCARAKTHGDCLRLLMDGPTVSGDGRYALAMALAQGVVMDEMTDAFRDMADPQSMLSAVLWTWTTYMLLLAVPEPLSKGVAAVMTASLIAYVGMDTFWSLIVGFKQLVEAAERATTFDALRDAGERYGKVLGRDAARAFVMLATAALGNTAAGLGAKVGQLPGAAQAALRAESQMGIHLAAVASVESAAVGAEVVTLSLAPGAVAMSDDGSNGGASRVRPSNPRGWASFSGFKKAMGSAGTNKEWHHLVEQTPGNVDRFGATSLHNTENVIPLDKGVHTRVSALYSSIRFDITESFTQTVRQWLSAQPFAAQREFGLMAIENVQKGFW